MGRIVMIIGAVALVVAVVVFALSRGSGDSDDDTAGPDTAQPDETTALDDTDPPADTDPSDQTDAPADTDPSDQTDAPADTDPSDQTDAPVDTDPPAGENPTASDVDDLTTGVVQSALTNARDFNGDYCRPYGESPEDPVGNTDRWPLFIGYNGPGDGGDFYDVCFIGEVSSWPVDVVVRDPEGDVAGTQRLWLSDEPANSRGADSGGYDDDVLVIGADGEGFRFSGVYVATPGVAHAEISMLLPHGRRAGAWTVDWSTGDGTITSTTEVPQLCPAGQGPVSGVFHYPPSAWKTEFPDEGEEVDNCIFMPNLVGRDIAEAADGFRISTAQLAPAIGFVPELITVSDCTSDSNGAITSQSATPNASLKFVPDVTVEFVGPCPTAPNLIGVPASEAVAALDSLVETHPFFSYRLFVCDGDAATVTSQDPAPETTSGLVTLTC